MVLTPVAPPPAPPVELMRSLFDLTPSGARVVRGLAAGETPEEIASAGGVAITTMRSQLRQVLEKTECTRQARACECHEAVREQYIDMFGKVAVETFPEASGLIQTV